MKECLDPLFFRDGKLIESAHFKTSNIYEGESFYEVLRVMDSIPLFLEDHLARLGRSLKIRNRTDKVDYRTISNGIASLISSTGFNAGNIKIVLNYNGGDPMLLIYFIEAQYPTQEVYSTGVPALLYHAERSDPTVKVINHRLRSTIYDFLIRKGAYEALLVNNHECITEGSRSNIFFITGGKLVTAPDRDVLGGITRQYILRLAEKNGYVTDFRCLPVSELSGIESVFLSGTSPHILPVRSVGDTSFNVMNEIYSELYKAFNEHVRNYIRSFK